MKNVRVGFLLLFFSFFLVALAFGRGHKVRTSSKEVGSEVAQAQSLELSARTPTRSFGGPNSYGYTWLDSDTTGGPLYNWIEISGIGTKILDSEWKAPNTWRKDDGTAGPFALGFQFTYNDTTYDSIYVGTNGILSFTESDLTRDGYFYEGWIPHLRFPDALAVFYCDLNLDAAAYGGGEVYYWTNSTDSFVVEYRNVKPFVSPATVDTLNFEVILVKTDLSITYQYKTVATPKSRNGNEPVRADSSALIGIQDHTRYFGLRYFAAGIEGYENLPKAGLAIKFKRTSNFVHNVVPAKEVLYYAEDYLYYYPPYHLFYTKEVDDTLMDNSVTVFNTGQNQEDSVSVICKIYRVENSGSYSFEDSFYTMLDSIVSGDTALVTFSENWVPGSRGAYLVAYYTALPSDDFPKDDTLSGYLFAEKNELTSPWTDTGPTCDGIMESGEWSDAISVDISKFAVPQLPYGPLVLVGPHYYQSDAAILYLKNDSSYLYLGLDLPGDTSNTMSDWVSIDIEDDGDRFFDLDSSEGALIMRNDFELGNDVLDFLPQRSTYSDSFVTAGIDVPVTAWDFGIQSNAGRQQAEIRIPFGYVPKYNLNSGPGETIGIWAGVADASDPYVEGGFVYSNQIAYWPWQGIFSYYPQEMARVYLSASPTSAPEDESDKVIASDYRLNQNYPNPFNPTTLISYQLPDPARVRINIYNILGQKINTLVDEIQVSGQHQVIWDGNDQKGRSVGSGIYFYKIVAGDYTRVRKMVLLK